MEPPMETAKQPDSWNNFRVAAISGDMTSVKTHHADKDFRILIQKDQSALDIAAQNGRTELVDYFLDNFGKFSDRKDELLRVLSTALRDACKYGQTEMVKILIRKLREYGEKHRLVDARELIPPNLYHFILLCAIACKKVEILNLIIDYYTSSSNNNKPDFSHDEAIQTVGIAFETGSVEILSTVLGYLHFKVTGTTKPVPECFIYCALGNTEEVFDEIKNNKKWNLARNTHNIGNFGLVYNVIPQTLETKRIKNMDVFPNGMRLVGVAARFGHFELVKKLIERIPKTELAKSLEEVLLQAWSTDQLEIVQWLHQSKKVQLKPPHSYQGINKFGTNRVFHYLRKICSSLEGVDPFMRRKLSVDELMNSYDFGIWIIENENSIEVINHYIDILGANLTRRRWSSVFTDSHTYNLPGFTLKLIGLGLGFITYMEFGELSICQWASGTLSPNDEEGHRDRELPCLPIVELVFDNVLLPVYGEIGRADMYLHILLKHHGSSQERSEADHHATKLDDLPYELFFSTIRAAVAFLVKLGAYANCDLIHGVMTESLRSVGVNNPHYVARACGLLDFFDVTREHLAPNSSCYSGSTCPEYDFFDDDIGEYLVHDEYDDDDDLDMHVTNRDVAQRNLLLGFLGCEKSTIEFPGLLVFLLRASEKIRKANIRLISFLDIVIVDPLLSEIDIRVIDPMLENLAIDDDEEDEIRYAPVKPVYDEVMSLSQNRQQVPTLVELVRNNLFKLIRRNQEMSRERGGVLSFRDSVAKFVLSPEGQSLPVSLQKLFKIPTIFPLD